MFRARPLLCFIAAAALALPAAGCRDDEAREDEARAAQRELGYEVQWLGRSFRGLPLTDVSSGPNGVGFTYGDCTPGDDTGCAPPLEIQVSSICQRNALLLDIRPPRSFVARGVTVLDYDGTLELATGETDVVIFAENQTLARRAVAALRTVGGVRRAALAPPRYPLYYLAELRRVRDTQARTRSVRAVRDQLGISQSQVRFELALALRVGAKRLRAIGRITPSLQTIKRNRATPGGPARPVRCSLEPRRR